MAEVENEGLSLLYRAWWRLRYTAMHFYGGAQMEGLADPHERLRRERAVKVEKARQERLARESKND
ncbi:hypothetical protein [Kribbia dieselivorans]|uniref:hypothetical protein n=1 Tax=Kribbia dieselivorans TaxID=331526 RepID=UPI000839A125|nr:hypothetical protein [Kribbia dieselivorans]